MMGRFSLNDLSGRNFGRLKVLGFGCKLSGRKTGWSCLCDCGNKVTVESSKLNSGHTKSCGCLQRERTSTANFRHGHGKLNGRPTVEYSTWLGMKKRCYDKNDQAYKNYGGRGITICDRWIHSFQNFFEDMGPKPIGLTIERKNNALGYCKENCVWDTPVVQANNKRNNIRITCFGKTMNLGQWSAEVGIHRETLVGRIKHGWPAELMLTQPPRAMTYNRP